MTGTPKKRSVEFLQGIEGFERGPYSGVFGYWCAGGGVTGLLRSAASFFMTPRGMVTKNGTLVLVVPSLLSLIRRLSGKRPMLNLTVLSVVSVLLAERGDGTG